MAVADGDPRDFAPDLFKRLTYVERVQSVERFGYLTTHKVKPEANADSATVARGSMIYGALAGGIAYCSMTVFLLFVVYLLPLGMPVGVLYGLVAAAFAAWLGFVAWRLHMINAYFQGLGPEGP